MSNNDSTAFDVRYKPSFKAIKKDRIKIAKQLGYSDSIIDQLAKAENEDQLYRLLKKGRESL